MKMCECVCEVFILKSNNDINILNCVRVEFTKVLRKK